MIQRQLRFLSRQSGLPADEAEELCSWALFKLVESNYRILAGWQGRSSLSAYLNVVLANLMRDYRIQVWGKWRPSAAARRQGEHAVLLDRLLHRDGLPLQEAISRMHEEHGVSLSRADLERIAAELPQRVGRQRLGEEDLSRITIEGDAEARLEDAERARTAALLQAVLVPLLRALPAEERLLPKLHYRDGFSVAAISGLLGTPQRKLYAARDRCLKRLRRALEEAGLEEERVDTLMGRSFWDIQPEDLWE